MSSALAGRFLTAAPPGKPFSSSCKDVALDLRSTLIQCDLTVTHFISKDAVSKQGHIMGFWVDLYSVVTLFIQCVWRLKSTLTRNLKFPLFFQLKTFLKEPGFVLYEGTFCTKTKLWKAALSSCLVEQGPQPLPFTPAAASCRPPGSASPRKGLSQNSELGNQAQVHTLLPAASVTPGSFSPLSLSHPCCQCGGQCPAPGLTLSMVLCTDHGRGGHTVGAQQVDA